MDTGNQDRTVQTAATTRLGDRCKVELPDRVGHLIFWPILLFGLLADLWTKQSVFAWLEHKEDQLARIIEGMLTFRMALNEGAAFGILPGRPTLLIGVSALALLVIFGVFFFGTGRQRLMQILLGFFAAGVSGNLWDRLFNEGRVRDFIDVYWGSHHWHTFNVADSMLCVAAVLLVVTILVTGSSDRTRVPPQR
jgi:signal peptidase II